jgi:phosphohistidine phosphatase
MKRLTVLRHAKSSWGEPDRDDFDRPLNERGWKTARRLGCELKHRGMRFDFALASPAARVRETLDGLAETYGEFPFAVRFESRIYMASEEILLELVRTLPDTANSPLLVGHNPGLERLILRLTRDDARGLRERIVDKYPTAALAAIDLPVGEWRSVQDASGSVAELILPKELD